MMMSRIERLKLFSSFFAGVVSAPPFSSPLSFPIFPGIEGKRADNKKDPWPFLSFLPSRNKRRRKRSWYLPRESEGGGKLAREQHESLSAAAPSLLFPFSFSSCVRGKKTGEGRKEASSIHSSIHQGRNQGGRVGEIFCTSVKAPKCSQIRLLFSTHTYMHVVVGTKSTTLQPHSCKDSRHKVSHSSPHPEGPFSLSLFSAFISETPALPRSLARSLSQLHSAPSARLGLGGGCHAECKEEIMKPADKDCGQIRASFGVIVPYRRQTWPHHPTRSRLARKSHPGGRSTGRDDQTTTKG